MWIKTTVFRQQRPRGGELFDMDKIIDLKEQKRIKRVQAMRRVTCKHDLILKPKIVEGVRYYFCAWCDTQLGRCNEFQPRGS